MCCCEERPSRIQNTFTVSQQLTHVLVHISRYQMILMGIVAYPKMTADTTLLEFIVSMF